MFKFRWNVSSFTASVSMPSFYLPCLKQTSRETLLIVIMIRHDTMLHPHLERSR